MEFIDKIKLIAEHESSFKFLDSVPFLKFYEANIINFYSPQLLPAYFCVSRNQPGYNPPLQENIFSIYFDFDLRGFRLVSFLRESGVEIELTLEALTYLRYYYEEKYTEHLLIESEKKKNTPKPVTVDDLYLIHDTVLNTLKIGRSSNPHSRVKSLQISTANRLELICIAENIGNFEKSVHDKFKHLRLASEWFKNDGEITKFFNSLNTVTV